MRTLGTQNNPGPAKLFHGKASVGSSAKVRVRQNPLATSVEPKQEKSHNILRARFAHTMEN